MAVFATVFCGCEHSFDADYSSLDLATAYGTISANGTPVVGATVVFEAEDKTWSSGVTDSSGYYQLMFNSEKKGVTPGPKIVRISYSSGEDDDGGEEDPDEGGKTTASADDIPSRYNSKSELKALIEPGDSHEFDFDLTI